MNKIKEKKLKSIKSEIVEITDFVASNFEDKNKKIFSNKKSVIKNNPKDTFVLSKIVNVNPNSSSQSHDIVLIKDELIRNRFNELFRSVDSIV